MKSIETVLVGYSGHGCVLAEAALCAGFKLSFYIDLSKAIRNPYDLSYLAPDINEHFQGWNKGYQYIIGIGDNITRLKIAQKLAGRNQLLPTIIHPQASVAKNAKFGDGVFVARNAAVNPLAIIGDYALLNTSCVIEHECRIGSAAHIGPGAVLAGNVYVGHRSFIGANSVVKQGVKIGDDVVIGAGSVIIKDVLDGRTVFGNPGKEVR